MSVATQKEQFCWSI